MQEKSVGESRLTKVAIYDPWASSNGRTRRVVGAVGEKNVSPKKKQFKFQELEGGDTSQCRNEMNISKELDVLLRQRFRGLKRC